MLKMNHPKRSSVRTAVQAIAAAGAAFVLSVGARAEDRPFDYRVLATTKSSTMERELNEAAAAGYRFSRVMGGRATNGGRVIIAMIRQPVAPGQEVRKYRLLATSKTSTMQTEIQQLADAGYTYVDHTVFDSSDRRTGSRRHHGTGFGQKPGTALFLSTSCDDPDFNDGKGIAGSGSTRILPAGIRRWQNGGGGQRDHLDPTEGKVTIPN